MAARWQEGYRCVRVNDFSKVRSAAGKARQVLPGAYTQPSSPSLHVLGNAKRKGSCKQNSLLLEARHRADVVGPEVVNDGSQAFDPLLQKKEKVFPVSKSTRAKPGGPY